MERVLFPRGRVCPDFRGTVMGLASAAHPTSPCTHTLGFTLGKWTCCIRGGLFSAINTVILCPLSKGMPAPSLSPIRWVVTLNSCKISLPSKGTRPLGTYRKEWGFPESSVGKNPPAMQETPVRFLGWEDPLEKG